MPVSCICEICSATFFVDPYRIRAGKVKYCSAACRSLGHRSAVASICLGCARSFLVQPALQARGCGKYCSRVCYNQAKRIPCICLGCQAPFTITFSAKERGEGSYCSPQCFQQHRPRIPFVERFWSHVDKTEGCWLWTGRRGRNGYGNVTFHQDGTQAMAHRVAYELTYGTILPGLFVCHTCDNPPCVRPDHLFLGTASDNMRDMVRKNRQRAKAKPKRVA